MSTVKHWTTGNFDAEVRAATGPVLVDFFATWCPPCRMLAPILERLAAELGDRATIAKVNIDEEPALAERFGIEVVPTLVLFEKGERVRELRGLVPPSTLRALLERTAA